MTQTSTDKQISIFAKLGMILGPVVFFAIYNSTPFTGLDAQDMTVLGILLWMVIWWISGPIPIYITALLPLVLMPTFAGVSIKALAGGYAHPIVFLILGGGFFSIALERANLNRKIALWLMEKLGYSQSRIIFSLCIVTWFFSMWMSNSATTMMMLPVALAIIAYMIQSASFHPKFAQCMLLMLAHSASVGGMSTLIGTPPNGVLASQAEVLGGIKIEFLDWMMIGLPISLVSFLIMYVLMTKYIYRLDSGVDAKLQQKLRNDYQQIGPITAGQGRLIAIFCTVVFFWIFKKSDVVQSVLPFAKSLTDTSIVMMGVFLLFLIRGDKKAPLINWYEDSKKLPIGVMLLIGGGIALAIVLRSTNLVSWVGAYMTSVGMLPLFVICIVIALFTTFLTEVNSNTATSIVLIPVFWGLGETIGADPMLLISVVALSASTAFMLPTATVPNAVVMQSEYLDVKHMMKSGIWLNMTIPVGIAIMVYYILPIVF